MKRLKSNRRQFIAATAATGVGFWISGLPAAESTSPNEKIRFACIGVGGKGKEEAHDASQKGDVVAICDIDDDVLDKLGAAHPNAKHFQDYRDMFDELGDNIDAVTVSTPDHWHAVIAAAAMRLGKAVFVQKPLAHSLWEARMLGQIAEETKVPTQMGNQGTAGNVLRKSAAMIKAGVLGPVKEVYVWTNRPIWDQGIDRPSPEPSPKALHWKLFIGPAADRPFGKGYHPFKWRGWWDFGTGSLGDMACHTMNMPFMALGLRNPTSVQAETTGHNGDSYPSKSKITYEFAATGDRPAVKMIWSDGAVKPPREILEAFKPNETEGGTKGGKKSAEKKADDDGDDSKSEMRRQPRMKYSDSGAIVVGEKGMMYAPGDYAEKKIQLAGVDEIEASIVESPGHFAEWVRAIKGGEPATSNFPGYAVPLTETVLLGNLAIWAAKEAGTPGKNIEWDAKTLTAKNAPEVAHIIKPELHHGYSL